jgi:hypothetical protein
VSTINTRLGNTLLESGFFPPCRAATTAAIALSGLQTIDGVALIDGDRVLVKNQADATTNGIYAASTGNWVRTSDAAGNAQFFDGMAVVVAQGTVSGGLIYICTATDDPVVVGTSSLTFADQAGVAQAGQKATSTTSLAIGSGTKTWTTQAGKNFSAKQWVLAYSTSNPDNNLLAEITSYSGTTLVANSVATSGSGTITDWTIVLNNTPAAAGRSPPVGFGNTTGAGSATAGGLVSFADTTGKVLAANAAVAVPGDISTTLAADQNDWSPGSATVQRINATSALTITGVAAPSAASTLLVLDNVGSADVTIAAENAGSSAANRFTLNRSRVIRPGQCSLHRYDTTSSRWRPVQSIESQTAFKPGGYLTLASSTTSPVLAADSIGGSTVYYSPIEHDQVALYDGSCWAPYAFAQLQLALNNPNHASNTLYDVYLALSSGAVVIGTGPAWSVSTAGSGARGAGAGTTELARQNGLLVNANAITLRNGVTTYSIGAKQALYVGTIFIDATVGQITCHLGYGQSRKWGVSNAFNQRRIFLQGGDPTGSWTYATNTIRQSRADAGNTLAVLTGLADGPAELEFGQHVSSAIGAGETSQIQIGIGVNSTTVMSSRRGVWVFEGGAGNPLGGDIVAHHVLAPTIGVNNINALEVTVTHAPSGSETYSGTQTTMLLSASWWG